VWNRVAPENVPVSLHTPQSGKSSWSPGVIEEEQSTVAEKGVERMKEIILKGLPEELRPQSWFYRVCVLLGYEADNRFIVRIVISKVPKLLGNKRFWPIHFPNTTSLLEIQLIEPVDSCRT
jgi:hypothetical protein